ncbi:Uncharacterised protein [Corynebacterium pilosum]|uniref:DUF559 domain-containing protein n=2 Tax=Corynebacterium pilosum TaxID=35756 RepID=A0A376CKD1_9CORY|nr:Uncharacterised protein [Corynebacterium pilosum]
MSFVDNSELSTGFLGLSAAPRAVPHAVCMKTQTLTPIYGNPDGTLSTAELQFITANYRGLRSAAITGLAGARIRGLKTYTPLTTLDLIHPDGVNAPARSRWKHSRRYTTGFISTSQVKILNGFRLAPLFPTLLHIQKLYGDLDSLVVLDSLRARSPQITEERFLSLADDYPSHSGVPGLREMILMSEASTRSPLESVGRYRLLTGNFPWIHSIEYEVKITIITETGQLVTYYADILINGFLVLELDGRSKYTMVYGKDPVDTVVQERIREHLIQNCGFVIRRAKWADMKPDAQGSCPFIRMVERAVHSYPEPLRPLPRHFQF